MYKGAFLVLTFTWLITFGIGNWAGGYVKDNYLIRDGLNFVHEHILTVDYSVNEIREKYSPAEAKEIIAGFGIHGQHMLETPNSRELEKNWVTGIWNSEANYSPWSYGSVVNVFVHYFQLFAEYLWIGFCGLGWIVGIAHMGAASKRTGYTPLDDFTMR